MKLFSKIVGKNHKKQPSNTTVTAYATAAAVPSPNGNPSSRQNSVSNEEQVPEYVFGDAETIEGEDLSQSEVGSRHSRYSSPLPPLPIHHSRNSSGDRGIASTPPVRLTDEERGMILLGNSKKSNSSNSNNHHNNNNNNDDMSISRPEESDPRHPVYRYNSKNLNRNNSANEDEEECKSAVDPPTRQSSGRSINSKNSRNSKSSKANNNNNNGNDDNSSATNIYQAQSEFNFVRNTSMHHQQSNIATPPSSSQMLQPGNDPYMFPPQLLPPQPFSSPPMLTPPEMMELNRLMSIGYAYDAALRMIGVDPNNTSNTSQPPPHMMSSPPPHPYSQHPNPMMISPPYYPPPHPMMPMSPYPPVPLAVPYQSYYPSPPHPMMAAQSMYGMPPPPPMHHQTPPRSASSYHSSNATYYQDNEEEMRIAMQRSLEEEERRKQQASEEEFMVKEAVERANERAVQIAIQRSFEEQYGSGTYHPDLAASLNYSQYSINNQSQIMNPNESYYQSQPSINSPASLDYEMIHQQGSAEIEIGNPMIEGLDPLPPQPQVPLRQPQQQPPQQQQPKPMDRPGVYYEKPSQPFSSPARNTNNNYNHYNHYNNTNNNNIDNNGNYNNYQYYPAGDDHSHHSGTSRGANDDSFYRLPSQT